MTSRKALFGSVAIAAASIMVVAACSSSKTSGTANTGGTPQTGGTAAFAELPGTQPNYIFPFTSSSWISVSNIDLFQFLMYRPLFWFGNGQQPTMNTSLSLANTPVVNGNTVDITLKNYKWSNGQPVTAQNVMFWLNMEQEIGATLYGAYNGFPTSQVSSMKVVSPTELTITMNKTYSSQWILYNDLSQVTPLPEAWDRTATGPSHCSTNPKDCDAVYKYLDAQSRNVNGWAGSPLWSIVDGPWKLSAADTNGRVTLVPNPSYSGPVKPKLAAFEELPYTTDSAEYNVLRSPSGSSKIDVGYVPQQDLQASPNGAAAANPLAGYTLNPWYQWGISFYTINEQSTVSDHAAIFKQLYFRQVMAYMMNQEAVIKGPLKGYGFLTTGPVATQPNSPWLSQQLKADPFPYSPSKAQTLLSSHGWNVAANGTTTCGNPSLCGAGIAKGTPLSFTFTYANGQAWIQQEAAQLQSNLAAIGVKLNLKPQPFTQVVQGEAGNCVVAKLPCGWDMADWGLGWSYYPDIEPTGETLFMCGTPANSGGFCDKNNDAQITQTLSNASDTLMQNWAAYLQQQLPVEWQPNAPYQVTEIASNLRGVAPQETTLNITPETWYFVK